MQETDVLQTTYRYLYNSKDSESDWDTASEADTKSPKRINAHYPKIDGIIEVPEEANWNPKEYKQYTIDDEDVLADRDKSPRFNRKTAENVRPASRNSSQRQSSAGSSRNVSRNTAEPATIGDFKSALSDTTATKNGYKTIAPGKERKGNLYDPPTEEKGSWDSEDDAKALADIRAVYEKAKVEEEEVKMKLGSSAVVLEIKEPQLTEKPRKNSSKHESIRDNHLPLRSGQTFLVEEEDETRIVYPFEEGHREFYHAVESPSQAYLPTIADQSEVYIRRCWQEIFAALRILSGFVFIFIVELLLFIMRDTVYKLFVKVIVMMGNFIIKPLLSNTFNSFVQPLLIFVWNVFAAIRNMLEPVIELLRSAAQQVALLLGSFRLVEINVHYGDALKQTRDLHPGVASPRMVSIQDV